MKKRITKQVRLELKWYKYAKTQAEECGTTISKILGKGMKYYSGEQKREDEEFEAGFEALFANRYTKSDKQKYVESAENTSGNQIVDNQ